MSFWKKDGLPRLNPNGTLRITKIMKPFINVFHICILYVFRVNVFHWIWGFVFQYNCMLSFKLRFTIFICLSSIFIIMHLNMFLNLEHLQDDYFNFLFTKNNVKDIILKSFKTIGSFICLSFSECLSYF